MSDAKPYTAEEIIEIGRIKGISHMAKKLLATIADRDEQIALSRRQLRECREMLKKHQWAEQAVFDQEYGWIQFFICPECGGQTYVHESDCALAAILKEEERC